MKIDNNVVDQDMVSKNNSPPPIELLLQVLEDTQVKLDNMEKRMNKLEA